jgi:hypothetical protein
LKPTKRMNQKQHVLFFDAYFFLSSRFTSE